MATYDPNIPQPTDELDQSQADILGNFQQADVVMGMNHYPFSDATASKGKHKFVTMPSGTPIALPLSTESVLFSSVYDLRQEITYTNSSIYPSTPPLTGPFFSGPSGFASLIGGIRIQWGTGTIATGSSVAVPFGTFLNPGVVNVFTNAWVVLVTQTSGISQVIKVVSLSATGFTAQVPSSTALTFNWFAIGDRV